MSDHVTVKMDDGSTVRGTPEAVSLALDIQADMRSKTELWKDALRQMGVVAAHPNDGWVKRGDKKEFHLAYAHFNFGLKVGDLAALGWGWEPWEKTWIVRVTGSTTIFFGEMTYWQYEFVRYMVETPREPKLNLLERLILRPFGIR